MDIDPRLPAIIDCLYRVAVKAIIFKNSKLLLVQEKDDEWWQFPGGGVDYGERPLVALARELHEELGLAPEETHTDGRLVLATTNGVVSHIPRINLYYLVEPPESEPKLTAHVIQFGWFSLEELGGMRFSPSITEAVEKLPNLLANLD